MSKPYDAALEGLRELKITILSMKPPPGDSAPPHIFPNWAKMTGSRHVWTMKRWTIDVHKEVTIRHDMIETKAIRAQSEAAAPRWPSWEWCKRFESYTEH
jgi:hypothetical protein